MIELYDKSDIEAYHFLLEKLKAENNAYLRKNEPRSISKIDIIPAHFLGYVDDVNDIFDLYVKKAKLKCLIDVNFVQTRLFDKSLMSLLSVFNIKYVMILVTTGPGFMEYKFINGEDNCFADYYKDMDFLLVDDDIIEKCTGDILQLLKNRSYRYRDLYQELKEVARDKYKVQIDDEFGKMIDDLIQDKYVKMTSDLLELDLDKLRRDKLKELLNRL